MRGFRIQQTNAPRNSFVSFNCFFFFNFLISILFCCPTFGSNENCRKFICANKILKLNAYIYGGLIEWALGRSHFKLQSAVRSGTVCASTRTWNQKQFFILREMSHRTYMMNDLFSLYSFCCCCCSVACVLLWLIFMLLFVFFFVTSLKTRHWLLTTSEQNAFSPKCSMRLFVHVASHSYSENSKKFVHWLVATQLILYSIIHMEL